MVSWNPPFSLRVKFFEIHPCRSLHSKYNSNFGYFFVDVIVVVI
jgi:hypothetical protein